MGFVFMNWLNENWFKLGVTMAIMVTAFSIGFYHVIYLPQKDQAKIEQEKQGQQMKEQKEQGTLILNTRAKQISKYRERCLGFEMENQKSRDRALESVRIACNQNDNPISCMKTFLKTQLDKLPDVGEDFVQACTNNLIKKYGTN